METHNLNADEPIARLLAEHMADNNRPIETLSE